MKKVHILFLFFCSLSAVIITGGTRIDGKSDGTIRMNEPIIDGIYIADPSAHVYENKLYLYPSHDIENNVPADDQGSSFDMKDYHVFSISDFNSPVTDHGEALNLRDIPWAKKQLWAPDAAFKNGTYYLYFPAKDDKGIFRIGVATSKKPYGPFTAQKNPIKGGFSIDPAVFVDDDGQAYMYFGGLMGGQLQRWTTGTYNENGVAAFGTDQKIYPRVAKMSKNMLEFEGPAKEAKIVDEKGNPVTLANYDKMFFEAAWMHKYNGTYYLSYSNGFPRQLVYATGKSPYGPFTFRGPIMNKVTGWTTHHSIVKYGDKWYLFYHEADSEKDLHLRRVKYTEIKYNPDGTIQFIKR